MSKGEARVPRSNGHEPLIDYAGVNRACFEMGATAGLPSSVKQILREEHCWRGQQSHPWKSCNHFHNTFSVPGSIRSVTPRRPMRDDRQAPALTCAKRSGWLQWT